LSGNLSHQIEHHLFPDVPANRYQEMAPKVREVCAEFGQQYNTAPFGSQILSVYKRLAVHSLPDSVVDRLVATKRTFVEAVKGMFGKTA
jgi:fatty acid desaturase